jgi:GNAT superfamily N-acetyltransferase
MRLSRFLRDSGRKDANLVDEGVEIPAGVHLLTRELQAGWSQFLNYGNGPPGATEENPDIWVVRDRWGRPVGGARVFWGSLPAIDIEIAPKFRRKGYATVLYEALSAAGFDTEVASDHALATGMLTPLGYAFMIGRRRGTTGRPERP